MNNDTQRADEFSRNRAHTAPFLGVLVLFMHQGLFYSWDWKATSPIQIGIWMAFAITMLLLLFSGGGWFLSSRARELANDEISRASRDIAIRRGFLAATITALMVVAVSPFQPIEAQRAAHLIFSIGLAVAFLVFGLEERKTNG